MPKSTAAAGLKGTRRRSARSKREKPLKPYDHFPLFAHDKGYWAKKVAGEQLSFGSWAWPDRVAYKQSWQDALKRWQDYEAARKLGQEIRARPERLTIETLVDAYLTHQEDRVGPKGIKARSFYDDRLACRHFRDAVGKDVTVVNLEASPHTVLDYLATLERRYGFHAYNKKVGRLVQMFAWAEHPLHGVLARPFRLRPLLKRKKDVVRKREKRLREAETGKERWTADELRALFEHAPMPLRAMLGLAYFAAFGNSDCADVPRTVLNFAPDAELELPDGWGVLSWQRPKTEVERAAVLPPRVVADLIDAMATRPEPADAEAHDNLVFLTGSRGPSGGVPWVRDVVHRDPQTGQILRTVNIDAVGQEFRRLRNRLGHCEKGCGWFAGGSQGTRGQGFRTDRLKLARVDRRPEPPAKCPTCGAKIVPMRKLRFYLFRHTAITYASGVAGADAVALFEGHAIAGVRKHYVEEIDTHELYRIACRLLSKLEGRTGVIAEPNAVTRSDGSTPAADPAAAGTSSTVSAASPSTLASSLLTS